MRIRLGNLVVLEVLVVGIRICAAVLAWLFAALITDVYQILEDQRPLELCILNTDGVINLK